MKTLNKIAIALSVLPLFLQSQITLEHTYPRQDATIFIAHLTQGDKYAVLTGNDLELFNMDYSAFKSVMLPIPPGYTLVSIAGVTDQVFDLDNQVEIPFTYSNGTDYHGIVYKEDGTITLGFNDCRLFRLYKNKLLATFTTEIRVYSLPGSTLDAIKENQPATQETEPVYFDILGRQITPSDPGVYIYRTNLRTGKELKQ